MSLVIGNRDASEGLSKAIYQELKSIFMPHFSDVDLTEEDLNKIREGWKKLSYAIAKGVVEHFIENLEIVGVQTKGTVNTTIEGVTGTESSHKHGVDLTGTELDVVFTQSNDGMGLVR